VREVTNQLQSNARLYSSVLSEIALCVRIDWTEVLPQFVCTRNYQTQF